MNELTLKWKTIDNLVLLTKYLYKEIDDRIVRSQPYVITYANLVFAHVARKHIGPPIPTIAILQVSRRSSVVRQER